MLLLFLSVSVASYDIVWNVQWPNECIDYDAPKDAVTKWGIRTNEGKNCMVDVYHCIDLLVVTKCWRNLLSSASS